MVRGARAQGNIITSHNVIKEMSSIFTICGIPHVVVSDNGPQYSSREFKDFAEEWGLTHVTSSLLHPQANGEAEMAVKMAKRRRMQTHTRDFGHTDLHLFKMV